MSYHGDIRLGDTIDIKFTTRRFSTGAPFTLAGTPAVSAYVGNGTTEITAGITLTVDFDTRTGLNNVRVVASGANGFATATNVQLVITAGTVDSVSVVGEVVGEFSIENRSALMPTTAGRTFDVSAGGEGGVDWANVGSPTTTVDLSGTTTNVVNTATAVTTVNGLAANVITAAATAADFSTEVNAGVLAVLGALNDAAADGAVTTTDTMVAYLKQLINTLEGAPGMPTWPAAAAPGNGVSIAEALRYVYDQIGVAGVALTEAGGTGDQLTALATQASVNTIDDFLDTEIATILSAVASKTGASVNDAAATTTSFKTTLTEVDDFWNDSVLVFTSGALAGQARPILDFANTNGVVTFDEALTSAPANGVTFLILPSHVHPIAQIQNGLATAAALTTLTTTVGAAGAGLTEAGGTGDQLTAIPWNAAWDAEVQSECTDALNAYDPPTKAELDAADDATLAAIAALNNISTAQVNAEVDTALADVGLTTTVTGRIDRAISAVLTTAMTEDYNADGVAPTPAQALFVIMQRLTEFAIVGTTITAKKLDGTTTAFTLTIDNATTPTSSTRST